MSLTEKINSQYDRRLSKPNVYGISDYQNASQNEIKLTAKALLDSCFEDLSKLKMLEIGAGHGTNAYMFEEIGLKRENISFNELSTQRLEQIQINFPNNKIYKGDAIEIEFHETYDIIFQSTVFTSILDDHSRKALATKMWDLLNPGGVILWYDFIYNNPKNSDVRKVSRAEASALFNKSSHSVIKKITLAPPIGRKVGKFYHLFNVPFLRTHILAIFQKGK